MVDVWFLAGAAALGILLLAVKALRCVAKRSSGAAATGHDVSPDDGLRSAG